jgi:hypothetical protein
VVIADLRIGKTDNADTRAREEAKMPNPGHQRNDEQTAANGARLILLREKLGRFNPAFDESRIAFVVVPDGSRRDPHGPVADAPRQPELQQPELSLLAERAATCEVEPFYDAKSAEQQRSEFDRGTSKTVGLLRCTGAIIGFLTGGACGAAVGAMLAVAAGDIIAQRSILIWLKLKSIALWRGDS